MKKLIPEPLLECISSGAESRLKLVFAHDDAPSSEANYWKFVSSFSGHAKTLC